MRKNLQNYARYFRSGMTYKEKLQQDRNIQQQRREEQKPIKEHLK